jgi:prevent-host-death family protein
MRREIKRHRARRDDIMDSWPQSLARQATENHPWQSSQERTARNEQERTGLTSQFNQSIYAFMKKVGITEAKNHLSALIDGLKNGSPVLIVDRGRPVARLEPATSATGADVDGRLSRLIREGIVRPSQNSGLRALFTDQPPRPKGGASVVAALIKERREGR